jgi:Holliday junction DNA helicase RuvB
VGQTQLKDNLSVFIQAARIRKEPLDHVLLYGPPGLGKTTLAQIIAVETGSEIKSTSGPAVERPIDLLVLLKSLRDGDILFIDEIHRLSRIVEEILYPAMEDFFFDRMPNKGLVNRSTRVELPRFTLIGATTRGGSISSPMRDRFGIVFHMNFYSAGELKAIVLRSAGILGIAVEDEAARIIAERSRGTPRIANRILKRVRDFAQVLTMGNVDEEVTAGALESLGIDSLGLDDTDRSILRNLILKFRGGPVGIETLAATVNEEPENIEEVYEPYLLQSGFLQKTPRGRMAAPLAYRHLGLPVETGGQESFL